jgi:hypothetical protein
LRRSGDSLAGRCGGGCLGLFLLLQRIMRMGGCIMGRMGGYKDREDKKAKRWRCSG